MKTLECSGCKVETDANLLDALLLDRHGNEATEGGYCAWCHPIWQIVPGDKWRRND